MKHTAKKKKKRSRPPKAPSNAATNEKQPQQQLDRQEHRQQVEATILDSLREDFGSISLEEAAYANERADGGPNKTGPGFEASTSRVTEHQQDNYAKGEEYHVFKKPAEEHWDYSRSCFQKAAKACSMGKWEYAVYLYDQGMRQTKLARHIDEKASQDIFKAKNKGIENVITINLDRQHLKHAMGILKLHLFFCTRLPTIRALRVIIGYGLHSGGKSELKQSVIKLLEMERLEWSEENQGTLLIKLDGYREFGFLDTISDSQ